MNLAHEISQYKFVQTRKILEELKANDYLEKYGACAKHLVTIKEHPYPLLVLQRENKIQFRIMEYNYHQQMFIPLYYRLIEDFKEGILPYIGEEAYQFGHKHGFDFSYSVSNQNYGFEGFLFLNEEHLFEFLFLVNRHGYFFID